MNSTDNIDISQKEIELKNLQNNIFQRNNNEEEKIYYNPNLQELKQNSSIRQKMTRGYIFCK